MLSRISPLLRVKLCLGFALVTTIALLFPARPAGAQTTYSGGSVSLGSTANASASSTITVSGAGTAVTAVKVGLNGITTNGMTGYSMWDAQFILTSPDGRKFVLLGNTGDGLDGDDLGDSGSGLSGVNLTIQDGASAAPDATPWAHTGSYTVKPSSYWKANGYSEPTSTYSYPQTDGSSTLTSAFTGATANGTWTLTVADYESTTHTGVGSAISLTSWSVTITSTTTITPTTTTISSSGNPANLSNSVTFTATVTGTGAPTGTVTFSKGGSNLTCSGGNPAVLSGGQATCTTSGSGLGQGLSNITASYGGDSSHGSSSGNMSELVEVTPTQNGNTWCNTNSMSVPNAGEGQAYPSLIKISGYPTGATVADVTVTLNNISWKGLEGQHLLVSPDGNHNLDFLDLGWASQTSTISPVTLTFFDTAGQTPDPTGNPSTGNYEAWDNNRNFPTFPASSAPLIDATIPQVPATDNFAAPIGSSSQTFVNDFNGATANGNWALYAYDNTGNGETIAGGWCITLDVNTGVGTTTTVTSNSNPLTKGNTVTFTATVTASGSPVTSGGTVTFLDNNQTPAGTVSGNNVVTLNGNGQATFTTSALAEGDHQITATYSGDSADNLSAGSMWQRVDDASTISAGSGGTINFCNSGPVSAAQAVTGQFTPNPSNIFVSNLPGTVSAVTLTLNNLNVGGAIDQTESLLKAPTGAALDFFSNTGSESTLVGLGNYTFSDGAGSTLGQSTLSPGTYKPTAYQNSSHSTDSFTSSSSGFYNAPGSFGYAAPHGSSTFANTFGTAIPNGTWSLFFNQVAGELPISVANGWCLNFTENPVTVQVNESHSGNGTGGDFVQGEQGAQITTSITNEGTGSTGDPVGTNPLKVVDTLNAALTYSSYSGTGWSCSASGQTVTCTNDSSVAQNASYPTLNLNVNVSGSAAASLSNTVNVSGAGITSTTGSDTITVDPAPVLAVSVGHTGTFTQGSTAEWDVNVSNTAAGSKTLGTMTVTDTLPSGYTLSGSTSTGNAWGCGAVSNVVTCTSTTSISGGSNSVINLTVNVPATSPTSVSDSASVYGGGDLTHTSPGTAAASNTDTVTVVQVPASVAITGGNSQSATIGTAFAAALAATVKDAGGVAIANYSPVSFAAATGTNGQSGTFSNSSTLITTTSNGSGQVSEAITANSKVGSYDVTVTAGTAQATFALTNLVGAPANIAATSGGGQSVTDTGAFTNPLVATVTDAGGNPVSGAVVTFTAPVQTGASVLFAGGVNTATTDASGVATSAAMTANTHVGTYNVTASVNSLQTTFQLTNFIGPLNQIVVTAPPSTFVGIPLQFTVTAEDVGGNVETGFTDTIQFSSSDGTAVLPSNSTLTGGTGTFLATLNLLGLQTVTATDTLNSFTGTSGNIAVNSLPNLVVTTASDDAGTAGNCTAQASAGTGTDASCSLRDALLQAASMGAANISFGSTAFATPTTITLNNGVLTIPAYTAISGATSGSGATLTNLVTVSGNHASPVFTAGSGVVNSSIANLIITDGASASNGGGIASAGSLKLTGSTISGNSATALGGGIYNTGSLTIYGSTITGNSGSNGGGVDNESTGTLTLTDATISGNTAGTNGGGISSAGTLTAADSTISGNFAGLGGGIYNSGGTLSLANAVLSGNQQGTLASPGNFDDLDDTSGNSTFTTGNIGGNIIGYYNAPSSTAPSPAIHLSVPGSYGGPTQTMLPLPGSPAICGGLQAAIPTGVTTDQRAFANTNLTYPGYSPGSPCVDAGAVQSNYALAFTQQPSTSSTTNTVDALVPISPAPAVSVTESGSGVSGASVTLSDSASALTGTTTQTTAAGTASFNAVSIGQAETNDTLTASVALNPGLPLAITTDSFPFNAAVVLPALVNPTPGGSVGGSSATFTWTPGSITTFMLRIGTTGPGSLDVYNSGAIAATSASVSNIPTSGGVLFVRLSYLLSGTWNFIDYKYDETGPTTAPVITSPTSGSALGGANVSFNWTQGSAAYFKLWAGTTGAGSSDVYNSGQITGTSANIANVPVVGATLYVRLYYLSHGTWSYVDTTYTEAGTVTLPAITSPAITSQLSGANVTFTWSRGSAAQFMLWAGTTGPGSSDIYNSRIIATTSAGVANIPTSGAPLYVRLSYMLNGAWSSIDYAYTEAGALTLPAITSPSAGSTLGGSTVSFSWSRGSAGEFKFWAGTTGPGASDLYNGGVTLSNTVTVANIPTNGGTLYVRLWYLLSGTWSFIDTTYTEAGVVTPPSITSPGTSGPLGGSSVPFSWNPGSAVKFKLWVGTLGLAADDVFNSGVITATAVNVTNIPTNGATLYVRLWYMLSGKWAYLDYTYTEAGTIMLPSITSPGTSGPLSGSSIPFVWNPGSAVQFMLWAGTKGPGSNDLYNSKFITATSATVPNVPANGAKLYVRLYYLLNGTWSSLDQVYTESGTVTLPAMISPGTGSPLPGSSATFNWSSGSAAAFMLRAGTTGPGTLDVFNSGVITTTSASVSGIPANGGTLYVRLSYLLNGNWSSIDYLYTEAGTATPPAITSPGPGSLLGGSSVTFGWTPGSATQFILRAGTMGAGTFDVFNSGVISSSSASVTNIPTNGGTLFVRLSYLLGGNWNYVDYSYTEAGTIALPAITSPSTGSPLGSSSAVFTWSQGSAAQFMLWVGTTGPGSSDVFNSRFITATSASVSNIPISEKLYVRLNYMLNGKWKSIDYVYPAAP